MSEPSPWERFKQARPIRVLGVYLGASWVVLSGVETLSGLFELPDWLAGATVVVLVVGLVVVGATAWVQSLSSTTAAEDRGEVPTDWEVAPADALASLRAGRLPHLTWGRVLVGGIVTLSLVIGAAGGYVLLTSGETRFGPTPVAAAGAPTGIAVLPFSVSGPDLDQYREGMVSLVSTNIDGVEGFRSIQPRSVIAAWQDAFGDETNVPEGEMLRVAGATGARYALVGDATAAGGTIRLTATLYDLTSGEPFPVGRAEGPADRILELIDEMSVNALRSLLTQRGTQSATQIQRLSGLITGSAEALDAYLEGEERFRRGEYPQAVEAFERAVAADSSFALAWSRKAGAQSWIPGREDAVVAEAQQRALALADRLPAREVTLLRGWGDITGGTWSRANLAALREHVRRFPDDPGGWNLLAEYLLHRPLPPEPGELDRALTRAVELDPAFESYYQHLLPILALEGDADRFERYLGSLVAANSPDTGRGYQATWDLLWGSPEDQAAARAFFTTSPGMAVVATDLSYAAVELDAAGALFLLEVIARVSPGTIRSNELVRRVSRGLQGPRPGAESDDLSALVSAYSALFAGLPPAPASDELSSEAVSDLLDIIAASDPPTDSLPVGIVDGDPIVRAAALRVAARDGAGALEILDGVQAGSTVGARVFSGLWGVVSAQALALAGDTEEAVQYFEGLRLVWPSFARLRLGELYAATGDTVRAQENFEAFLRLYAEADQGRAALMQRGRDGLEGLGR